MAVMVHEESKDLMPGTLAIELGRLGSAVAVTLDELGYEISAVEGDLARVRVLVGCFSLVETDATSTDVLKQFGAREFRAVAVGAGPSLESLVLIIANFVDLGIPFIWTKAISRKRGWILRRIDAHHVTYPEFGAGQRMAHPVGGRMIDYIEVEKGGFAITKLRPPREARGFTLEDLDLWGRYGMNMLGILCPGQFFEYAKAQARINPKDIVIASGDARLLEYFANHL